VTDLLRQEIVTTATTIVVKVGTRVLSRDDGTLDQERITRLAEELNSLLEVGKRVVLVSSGAVGAGMSQLEMDQRPTDLATLQAVAAIGQTNLVEAYDRTLRSHGRHAAQVLLTAEDLHDRTRYLNVRNTILALLSLGAVPIINENDTVAVDELKTTFGDNDRLAAMVTNLLQAPLLVVLSDVDGLYDGHPADHASQVIPTITQINDQTMSLVRDQQTGVSKGGMASKLEAARMVTSAGENVIIASGRTPNVLADIMQGHVTGTLFVAQGKSVSPKKRWIAFSAQPQGSLGIDAGAAQALQREGRSLLAIGIRNVTGNFRKGDVVVIYNPEGQEIARGLTNYSTTDLQKIKGRQSREIADLLGHCPYDEVVHRDNLNLASSP